MTPRSALPLPREMDLPSLATAALIGWEWLQREVEMKSVR